MTPTDTSEAGLETLICRVLTGTDCVPRPAGTSELVTEKPPSLNGLGWLPGNPANYDREYCVDLVQLIAFLRSTQPEVAEPLDLENDSPTRHKFLVGLQGEVSKRGRSIRRTALPSRASSATAAKRPSGRWTWCSSSMVYRSSPSSSKTASPNRQCTTPSSNTSATATHAKSSLNWAAA